MKRQIYNYSYILIGVLLIGCGIGVFVYRSHFITRATEFLSMMIIALSFLHLLRVMFVNNQFKSYKDVLSEIIEVSISVFIGLWIYNHSARSINLMSTLLGLYLILIGVISIISTVLLLKDRSPARYWRGFYGVAHVMLGLASFNLSIKEDSVLSVIGLYLILLGFTFITDGWGAVFFDRNGDTFRRHIRFSIPIVFHAHLPKKLLEKLKVYLTNSKEGGNQIILTTSPKADENVLQIIFSTSPDNIDLLGHINLAYKGYIYNYGNYDVDSRRLLDSIGDGVLAVVEKEKFTEFNLKRGQTMVEYDIPLNTKQEERLDIRFKQLMANIIEWEPITVTQLKSHSGQLKQIADAQMYKFTKGKYQTYFVFGTNCVLLVDDIIGSLGTDKFVMVGILTPGTYFDFLEKEVQKPNSWVKNRKVLQLPAEKYPKSMTSGANLIE